MKIQTTIQMKLLVIQAATLFMVMLCASAVAQLVTNSPVSAAPDAGGFSWKMVLDVVLTLLASLSTVLLGWGSLWLKKKLNADATLSAAIDAVREAVIQIYAEFVRQYKLAGNGKMTPEQKKQVVDLAIKRAIELAKSEPVKELIRQQGASLVEKMVNLFKKDAVIPVIDVPATVKPA